MTNDYPSVSGSNLINIYEEMSPLLEYIYHKVNIYTGRCSFCNAEISESDTICPSCGREL